MLFSEDYSYEMINPGALALLGTGVLFMESSSLLIRPMLLVEQKNVLAAYDEYQQQTTELPDDYDFNDGSFANKLQVLGLANSSAGLLFASSLFFFPDEQVTISTFGKIGLIAGLATILAGNILDYIALNSYAGSEYYAYYYENATEGAGDIYNDYAATLAAYTGVSALGLLLKGVGGVITAASFILPGKKEPYFKNTLHKILNAGALALFAAGTVTKAAAQLYLVQSPYAWIEYNEATANAGALYAEYERLNSTYTALSLTSYGLWIAGGSALITSLFLPDTGTQERMASREDAQLEKTSVSIMPSYNGNFGIGLTISK